MYYDHFGLNEPPFRITPNTEFFFGGGNRGPILEALIYAVMQGEGMIKVSGEVGSGKTMLCNMLQARLPLNVDTVYLAHPGVPPEEILRAITFELQIGSSGGASRLELMHALQQYLLGRYAQGRRVVVVVEEAQSMPLATLEEIRLLSNLETRNDKLLQIVLFGQPEFDEILRRPAIRQLRERVAHSFRLEPLTAVEIHEYLMFRLRAAGYRGPGLFSRAVVKRIARASEGLTRRVNLIADKALLAAFAENTHTITTRHVDAAVRDSEFSRGPRPWLRRAAARWVVVALGAGVVGAGAYVLTRPADALRPPPSTASAVEAPAAPEGTLTAADAALRAAEATRFRDGTAGPRGQAPIGSERLVEQRLAATQEWLANADPGAITIQLMQAEHELPLARDLSELARFVEINEVFLYRTEANRRTALSVLYGSFSDRRSAQDALDKLPAAWKANRPFLRTVRSVRNEVGQRRGAQAFGVHIRPRSKG